MKKVKKALLKIATLNGSEHNIAMGVAIGIFVAVTPTIPFHTVFAIFLAFLLNGSKRAAIISVWFSNPFTIPIFYTGAYYTGVKILGLHHSNIQLIFDLLHTLEADITLGDKIDAIVLFFKAELPVFYAMIAGGVILGIPPAVGSYFLTKVWVKNFRKKKENSINDGTL